MKKILFIILSLFSHSSFADSKLKIAVTIPPLASLVKMIAGDQAEVKIIINTSSCPHHAHLKPSEIASIKNSDVLIYIDQNFESNIIKYFSNDSALKLEISKLKNIRLEKSNYHLWTDINNAKVIISNIKLALEQLGLKKELLDNNYNKALEKLQNIEELELPKDVLFLGESLYYLSNQEKDNYFLISHNPSLKKVIELKAILKNRNISCVIYDENISPSLLTKFYNGKSVFLNIEDWSNYDKALELYYFNYLYKIKSQAANCLNNK